MGARYAAMFMELEARIAFDGAGAETVEKTQQGAHEGGAPASADAASGHHDIAALSAALALAHPAPAVESVHREALAERTPQAAETVPARGPVEIVFVDPTVEGTDQLVAGISGNFEVVVLDAGRDGVAQIAAALSGRRDVAALHIISHGNAGTLSLGTATLDSLSMTGEHAQALKEIGESLSVDADILVYGCNFGEGARGAVATDLLGRLTGADIAASTDLTGAADRHGNWVLERQTGHIESRVAIDAATQAAFEATLNASASTGKGAFVVVVGRTFYSVDATTGKATAISTAPGTIGSIDVSNTLNSLGADQANGLIYFTDSASQNANRGLFAYDYVNNSYLLIDSDLTDNGAGKSLVVGSSGLGGGAAAFANDALFLGVENVSGSDDQIYRLTFSDNGRTLAAISTFGGLVGGNNNWGDFALDPAKNVLLSISGTAGATITRYDLATGSILGTITGNTATIQGGGDAAGNAYLVGASFQQIDPVTGALIGSAITITTNGTNPLGAPTDATTFTPQTGTIGDRVFDDNNLDGVFGAGDTGLSGVTVQLIDDVNGNGTADAGERVLATDTTDAAGRYLFTSVLPGAYVVRVSDAGGVLGTAPATTGTTKAVTITRVGGSDLSADFGYNARPPLIDLDGGTPTAIALTGSSSSRDVVSGGTFSGASPNIALIGSADNAFAWNFTVASPLDVAGTRAVLNLSTIERSFKIAVNGSAIHSATDFQLVADSRSTGEVLLRFADGAEVASPQLANTNRLPRVQVILTPQGIEFWGTRTTSSTVLERLVPDSGTVTLPVFVQGGNTIDFINTGGNYASSVSGTLTVTAPDFDYATSYSENGASVSVGGPQLSVFDPDSTTLAAAVVTLTNVQSGDLLVIDGTLPSGIRAATDTSVTGRITVTLSGTASRASYEAAIRQVHYLSTSDAPPTVARTVTVNVSDGGLLSNTATTTIAVMAVNDAPVNGLPAGFTTGENTRLTLSGLSVSDADAASGALTVTLGVGSGTLSAASGGGVTVSGSGSATLTLSGTLAGLNAYLAGATAPVFVPVANASGPVTLTMTTRDNGNTGVGGSLSDTDTTTITVAQVNDAPVNTLPAGYSGTEDNSLTLTGLSISDSDAGSGTMTVTLAVASGSLGAVSGGGVVVSGAGTGTLTLSGTLANLNAYLASTAAPVFVPAADVNGPVTLTMTTNDGGNTGPGGPMSDVDSVAITLAAVNDAPVIDLDTTAPGTGTAVAYTENGAGVAVVSANLSVSDVDNANLTSATIAIANAQAGDLLAINGTLPSGISASYSAASATLTLSGSASKAAYAAALGQVRYLSTSENPSTVSRTINIAVSDGALGSNVAMATVSVNAVNDAPVAGADSFSTDDKTAVTLDVLANDRDVDGGSSRVTEVDGTPISAGGPAVSVTGGRVALNADRTLTFTPTTPYSGNPSFRYTVSDGQGGTAMGTVSGTVSSVETAPVAADDRIAATEDTPVTFDVRLNDSDRDNDPLAVTAIDGQSVVAGGSVAVSGGSIRLNADGTLTFTPTADVNGPVRFGYTISDGRSGTASATALIEVAAVQDAPRLGADSFSASEDGSATIAVLANDSDPDGDALTITAIDGTAIAVGGTVATAGGTVTLNADGTLRFVPAANFNGPVSFSYAVSDGQGNVSTAMVSGTIVAVNDAPVAGADSFVTAEDTAVVIDVLGNDSDVDRDAISVIEINGTRIVAGNTLAVTGGRVMLNADGTLTFTPDADVNGPVGFSYTISDGKGGSATASVSGSVTAVNDAPVLRADSFTTAEDTALILTPLQNDADPEGDALAITAIDGQSIGVGDTVAVSNGHGTVTLNADGSLTFRPAADYNGPIRFDYTVSDGSLSTSATVSGTVTAVNDAPTAGDASLSTAEDTTVSGQLPAAIDADGDTPTYALGTTAPASGTVTISPGGAYTYTPKANFNGTDRFSYSVSDGQGGSREYTVAVTVTAVNDTPTSTAMPNRMRLDGQAESFDASQYFTDADGDRLTYSQTGLPAGLTISASGQVTGTIDRSASRGGPNGDGVYTVTITATDPSGATVTGTYTAVVTNPAPVAVDDAAVTSEDVPVSFNVLDGTASGGSADRDPDGDPIRLVSASAAHGTVAFTPDGATTYTPNANYTGRDTITYVIADGDGGTATAMVAVTVVSVNDQPIGTGIPDRTRTDGQPENLDASAFFSDPDGDSLTYTASGLPAGLAIDQQTGLISGTINAGASGVSGVQVYAVTIIARDGLTNSDGSPSQGSVTFNYTVVNIPPDARDDSATTAEETAVDIDVRDNDRDADNDALAIVRVNGTALTLNGPAVTTPNGAVTLVLDANGRAVLRFVPKLDFTGTESFDYTLADPNGGKDSAAVTVRVTGINDAPRATGPAPALTAVDGEVIDRNLAPLFTDVDGDALTFTAANLPAGLSLGSAGRLTGTIDRAASQANGGVYQVVITATDPSGASETQSFQWTVANPSRAPVAVDDVATTAEDMAVDINVLDGTASANGRDSDPDGDTLTVVSASAANGTVVIGTGGSLTYRPNADFNGADTIIYRISDGQGGFATGSVAVTVTAVNDDPVATPLPALLRNDGAPVSFDLSGSFRDVDGDKLTYDVTGLPPGLSFDPATGIISGTIAANASGATGSKNYVLAVTATDGRGGSASFSSTLTVTNIAPVAAFDTRTTAEDTPLDIDVLANDSDPDGDTIGIVSVNGTAITRGGSPVSTAHGQVELVDTTVGGVLRTVLRYTPNADFNGTDSFSYGIADDNGGTASASITVTVEAGNDAPTTATIPARSGVDGGLVRFELANAFSDPDGDTLTYSATGLPDGLTIDAATGVVSGRLKPDASQVGGGVYRVTVTASDGRLGVDAAFTYTIANPAPTAGNDRVTTTEDTPVSFDPITGANTADGVADVDPDGDPLTITAINGVAIADGGSVVLAQGTITRSGASLLTFTPNPNANGTQSFVYQISDGQGGTADAVVTIAISAVGDAASLDLNGPATGIDYAAVFNEGDAPVRLADAAASIVDAEDDIVALQLTVTGAGRDGAAEIIRLGGSVALVGGTAASGTIIVGGTNFAFRYDGAGGLAIASAAGAGTAMPAADLQALIGSLRYENTSDNPTAGVRSFAFTATDSAGLASPTATTSITVAGANDAPVARPDTAATDANTALNFGGTPSLLLNDCDPEGDVLTVSAVDGASAGVGAGVAGSSGGQFVIRADGNYSFDPGADFKDLRGGETRTTSVFYTVSDGAGATAEAVLSVTVTGLNDEPVGADLAISLQEDGSASGTLPLASDVDGDALRYAVATAPAHGTVSISLNGDYTYVPFADFNGADSFTYTVSDGTTAVVYTVSVTVAAVNDGPTGPSTVSDLALQDAARTTVPLAGYFSDADGDTLVYTALNLPAGLTLDRMTGVLSGTVDAGASQLGGGRYAVVIQATDAAGAFTTARFTIVVTNPPPIAVDDRVTTSQDSTVSGSVLADNGNGADSDPDGDALVVSSVGGSAASVGAAVAGSAGGSFTLNADGTYSFAPGTDFIGLGAGETRATSIRYAISDGQGGTSEAVLTVTVTGTDEPPVGAATRFTATEDTAYSGTLPAASDPDGDPVVYGIGTPPANGDLQVRADGTFRYTPAADYHGPDSFTYTVTSGGVAVPYTVTVDVTSVNDVPVAAPDDFTVAENGSAILAVLGNDRDADGDRLAVTEIDGVAIAAGQSRAVTGGSVTLGSNGTLTFTATPGYSGPARFSYTVSDGTSRAIGSVTGAVTAVNDAPANTLPATFNAVEDTPLRLAGLSVADADAGSNPISVTLDVSRGTLTAMGAGGVRVGGSGTAHLTLTGTLASINGFLAGMNAPVYVPAQDATGTVRLTMTTDDGGNAGAGGAQSASSVADILIEARNDLPTAGDVSLSTKVGQPVSGAILGRDVDGDALTYRLVAQPPGGTVRLDTDGRFSFTPAPNFAGQARFEVTLDDGQGGTATVRVVVDVTRPNEAPVGSDVSAATREDEPLTGRLPVAVDAEGAPLTYALAANAANGRAVVRADGSYTYTPNADFNGSDSFTYSVSDGTTAVVYTVTVSVAAVNDAPVVTSPTRLSAIEDRPLSGSIAARDVDGDPVTFALATAPAHGSVVVNADGTFTYTPAADFNGGDSFAVAVSDGRGGTRIETFSVSVDAVPDLPVTGADSFTVPEDGTVTLDVTGNDRDPDGTALTVTEINGQKITVGAPVRIASGTVALNPDGTLSFTPSPDYNGPVGFSYTVRNAAGLASTGSVGGSVAAVNDAPVLPPLRIDAVAGGPTTGTLGGFDPDGDPLIYTVTQVPRNGTLTLSADGRYSYVPTPGYTGSDSFSFSVSDGTATVTGSATIGVRPGRTEAVTVDIDVPAPGPDANVSSRTIGRPVRSVDADGEVLVAVGGLGSIDAGPVGQRSLDNAIDAMQDLNGLAGMPADELIARTVRAQTDWRETGGLVDGFTEAPFLGGSDIGQLLSQRDGTSFVVDTTINEGVLYVMVAASETREGTRIGHETRVTLADGRALPAWLSAQNGGVVFGYPPAGLETIALKVQAVDENGAVSQSVITIDVRSGAVTENLRGNEAAAAGATLFSQQLRAELADIGEGIADLYNALRF